MADLLHLNCDLGFYSLWGVLLTMRTNYKTPEEAFSKEQIEFLTQLVFSPMYQEQTKEFLWYRKQYGPIGGSYLFVFPEKQVGYNSQIVMDRNVFLHGHKECYEDHQKLKSSGLFL
jgi:hypothetical protein